MKNDACRRCVHWDDCHLRMVERETMVGLVRKGIIDKRCGNRIVEYSRNRQGMSETILPECKARCEMSGEDVELLASSCYLTIQGVRGQDGVPWAVDHVQGKLRSGEPVGSLAFFEDMATAGEAAPVNLSHPEGRHPRFTGLPFLQSNASGAAANGFFQQAAVRTKPLFRRILSPADFGPVTDDEIVDIVKACSGIAISASSKSGKGGVGWILTEHFL